MKRTGWIIAGFVLLSAVAVAGWVRKPSVTLPQTAFDQAGCAANPAHDASAYQPVRRIVQPRYAPATGTYLKKRSTRNSVAIVAGSAGVGAAIGALAGGGRGAAIGALSGATGGFIYDRLTHKRRVPAGS